MDNSAQFTRWAEERGVRINGIAVREDRYGGFGIIAERRLKPQEPILSVPRTALLLASSVDKTIPQSLRNEITVHGLLATELCLHLDTSDALAPWRSILPKPETFDASIPLTWPEHLQQLLPPTALELLEKQRQKFIADWTKASTVYPSLEQSKYLHNWLLVGTRCFFYQPSPTSTTNKRQLSSQPSSKKHKSKPDDSMALCPFADIFNHSALPSGCNVIVNWEGITFTTVRDFEVGEEVCFTYGPHSNDTLLVEYGFVLEAGANPFDNIALDALIMPRLDGHQREMLEDAGYEGKYTLDVKGPCFRTEVALRLLVGIKPGEWRRFIYGMSGGERWEAESSRRVNELLAQILTGFLEETVEARIKEIGGIDSERYGAQREVLMRRWMQIRDLIRAWLQGEAETVL